MNSQATFKQTTVPFDYPRAIRDTAPRGRLINGDISGRGAHARLGELPGDGTTAADLVLCESARPVPVSSDERHSVSSVENLA
jgi:hypothetical protein